jgi:hypothetical protein
MYKIHRFILDNSILYDDIAQLKELDMVGISKTALGDKVYLVPVNSEHYETVLRIGTCKVTKKQKVIEISYSSPTFEETKLIRRITISMEYEPSGIPVKRSVLHYVRGVYTITKNYQAMIDFMNSNDVELAMVNRCTLGRVSPLVKLYAKDLEIWYGETIQAIFPVNIEKLKEYLDKIVEEGMIVAQAEKNKLRIYAWFTEQPIRYFSIEFLMDPNTQEVSDIRFYSKILPTGWTCDYYISVKSYIQKIISKFQQQQQQQQSK